MHLAKIEFVSCYKFEDLSDSQACLDLIVEI
eukprot:SAG22_NODE_6174_length_890_cov_0.988622_1_plen_30_part_10